MHRITVLRPALVATLLLGALSLPSISSAEPREGWEPREHAGWQHHGDRHHQRGHNAMRDPFLRALHELHLTPEQRKSVHSILTKAWEQERSQREAARTTHKALLNPGDPQHAAAVQAAQQRAAGRVQRHSEVQAQIYALLTPEQKSALPGILEHPWHHGERGWGHHGDHFG